MININRHVSPSKGVKVTIIALAEEEKLIMKKAFVSSLSPLGFKLIFHNRNFISEKLQTNFYNLWQKELYMYIPDMEIDLNGVITGGAIFKKWKVGSQCGVSFLYPSVLA